jgi:hypothetical protein
MDGMTAEQIDVSKMNPEYKGMKVRVKPLYDIYDNGKQSGFGLNVRLPGKKRFSESKYMPFFFADEGEADLAAGKLNAWSVSH